MAFLFSHSFAMDKFVICKVVTAIDYPSIQFSIRLAVATVVAQSSGVPTPRRECRPRQCGHPSDDAADLVLQGGPFLAALDNTRMHRSTRVRNWTFVSVRRNQNQRVSRSDKSFERESAHRAD